MNHYRLVTEYHLTNLPILVRHFSNAKKKHVVIMSALASGDIRVHPIKNYGQYMLDFWKSNLNSINLEQVHWFTHFGQFSEEPSWGNWSMNYDEFSWHQFKLDKGQWIEIANQSLNQHQLEQLLGIAVLPIEV